VIPCVLIYRRFAYGEKILLAIICALAVFLSGFCFFCLNDVQFNLGGFGMAVVAVATTVVFQIQTNAFRRLHGLSTIQLGHAISLSQFLIAFFASLTIETWGSHNLFRHTVDQNELVLIGFSGCLLVLGIWVDASLEGSTVLRFGRHLDAVVVFLFGLWIFPVKDQPREKRDKKIKGWVVAMVGVILFTIFDVINQRWRRLGARRIGKEETLLADTGEVFQTAGLDEDD
jgi:hypothetical protein